MKSFIPSRPTEEQEAVMLELYEASFNGEPYDVSRWFNIFKPDNVYFDEAGNIKDLKTNNEATTTATEIPSSYNPIRAGEQMFMNQFAESTKVPYNGNPENPTNKPVWTNSAQSQPTAPQLIKENTVEVNGDNPTAVISDILSKFKIPQQG